MVRPAFDFEIKVSILRLMVYPQWRHCNALNPVNMKNRTSLFVLAVEILAIVLLHTMKASADAPPDLSAKQEPAPLKTELATKEQKHHLLLTTLK